MEEQQNRQGPHQCKQRDAKQHIFSDMISKEITPVLDIQIGDTVIYDSPNEQADNRCDCGLYPLCTIDGISEIQDRQYLAVFLVCDKCSCGKPLPFLGYFSGVFPLVEPPPEPDTNLLTTLTIIRMIEYTERLYRQTAIRHQNN